MAANNRMLKDGFSTTISFENAPTIKMYEKEVTPPGMQGGGEIDITTMRNIRIRTKASKQLISFSPLQATVAYATDIYDTIMDQLQVNQRITLTFSDGSSMVYWGWLDDFTPGAFTEGEQPTASVTFIISAMDSDDNEVMPDYIGPSGSGEGS